MSESEPRQRRGRPRVPDAERKRHTLTFRMRGVLKDAVEELAEANGRTISEQVEYYVDNAVFAEAKYLHEYSAGPMSSVLYRCISAHQKSTSNLNIHSAVSKIRHVSLTIGGANDLENSQSSVSKSSSHGYEGEALDKARALLDGTVRGMLETFEVMLGSDVVAAIQENGAIGQSSINIRTNIAYKNIENRCLKAEAEVEQLRKEINLLKSYGSSLCGPTSTPVVRPHNPEGDFSIAALRNLVAQLGEDPSDLRLLRDARWPKWFNELPSDTRENLVVKLGDEAGLIYEALMVPVRSHPAVLKKSTKASRVDFDRMTIIRALHHIQAALPSDITLSGAVDDTETERVSVKR